MRARVVLVYLGAGLAVVAGLALLSVGRVTAGVVSGATGLAAVVAMVRGSRRQVPDDTAGWHLLSAGVLALVMGEVLGALFATRALDAEPTPADVLRLGGYVLAAAGVVRIQRPIRAEAPGASALEAALVALGLGLVAWQVALDPVLDHIPTPGDRALAIAYPAVALGVVAVAAWAGVVLRRATRSQLMLGLGLLHLFAAELISAAAAGGRGAIAASAVRTAAFLLLGGAALDPSLAPSDPSASFGRARLGVLGAATLLGPVALILEARDAHAWAFTPFAAVSAGLVLILLMRTRLLVRQHDGAEAALRNAADELRKTEAERRRLLAETIRAGERQRSEMAYELHDGPIQQLAAVGYMLDRAVIAHRRGDTESERTLLEKTSRALRHEVGNLRALMVALRPPALDEQGLEDALRDQASAFTRQTGVPCVVQSELRERLSTDLEVLLYRVSQEALRNVAKHARASRAGVRLAAFNGSVQLEVRDDGAGFDLWRIREAAMPGHVGLLSMREQVEMAGGTWRIDSRPGAGTRIQATIPRRTE
jgi:signal transduction histidine kinase